MINVLALSDEKIKFLLTNHKYFSPAEIILAAKMKVMSDKKPKPSDLARHQNDICLRGMQGGGNPYLSGYNQQSILGGLF